MIPQAAIDEFLHARREDHRWIKELTVPELDRALAALNPVPRLYPKARKHQKACFLLGVAWPQYGFWLDMGLGKTLLALELLRYWWDVGHLRRALILVTSDKAYLTWETQIELYGIDLPYVFLSGSSEDKWEQLEAFGDGLVIVHYPGLVAMLTSRASKSWVVDDDKIERFLVQKLDGVVADESTKLGNQNSLTYKIATKLSKNAYTRYELAGRPFGRDPALAWSQFKLIDNGATLGQTMGLFREAFCSSEKNYAARGKRAKYVRDFKFKKRMMPQLTRIMQHRSITYADHECPDLPPLARTSQVVPVRIPDEAEAYYQRLIDQAIAAKGNLSLMKNVFMRMRQLSSGFLAMRDDETGDRVEIEFDENPKLDRLLELIDEMPLDRQAVVFYAFTHSGRRITEALKAAGIDNIWLWSGTKDSKATLQHFIKNPSCTVAVINNQVGAYSLDGLQVANYSMFYESPVSCLDRQQAEARLLRQGQKRHVFQYDLVVRHTVDERILDFHKEGRSLYEELTRDPRRVLMGW
jgi:phage gpG-like protein